MAATLLTAALGKRVLRTRSHLPVVLAMAASCVASVLLVFAVERDRLAPSGAEKPIGYQKTVTLWTWASVSASPLPAGEGQG